VAIAVVEVQVLSSACVKRAFGPVCVRGLFDERGV